MASKFGLAGGIPERRVRPIWDAIDSRQFKNALKHSTSLLAKCPNSPYALVRLQIFLRLTQLLIANYCKVKWFCVFTFANWILLRVLALSFFSPVTDIISCSFFSYLLSEQICKVYLCLRVYVCADIWSFFYPGIKWRMLVVLPSQLFINLASLVFGFEHVVFMIEGLVGE